jgi:hypothetical protein
MTGVEAKWSVLECAFDEFNLWELPGRHVYVHSGGQAVTPDLPVAEVRAALVAALSHGLVELYDQDEQGYPALALEDALALVADEHEWTADSASRRVALSVTALGERASHEVSARRPKASLFHAAGMADPHTIPASDD